MAFEPIYNHFATRPKPQALRAGKLIPFLHTLRDNFSLTTWLLFGAVLQGLLILTLPYKNLTLIAPAFLLLAYKFLVLLLTCFHVLPNKGMEGVLGYRTVPVFPNEKTGEQDTPAGQSVCAILLAVQSNSPLGMFAPGFKEVGDLFAAMIVELDRNAETSGYLGSSSWLSASDRQAGSENMGFIYFENEQKLHEFAHGPLHTKAMEWWSKDEHKMAHIGIMHEVFACPKNSWEGIYVNYHPTGLGATTKQVEVDGKKVWVNPLVKGRGRLTYSKGRMGKPFGSKEWEAFDRTLGEDDEVEFRDEKV